ncbi:MAG: nucleotidyltransferase family protein [Lachnospiraceae bacterium]|nr:nucleotidyltransferase family protein [Lachnospiraceae bacterium]
MKTVGIIAEYNPFHSGHRYHMEEAVKKSGADAVVVIMSGDFVQRGEPAVLDKYQRAEAALSAGADLVLELPPSKATGGAELFARGAVQMAAACGCVDTLCFGAEEADLSRLQEAAGLWQREDFEDALQAALRQGLAFPAAVAEAAARVCPAAAAVLDRPNNILAVEYLKAIRKQGSTVQPLVIPRIASDYRSDELPQEGFASAGALRKALRAGRLKEAASFLPEPLPEDAAFVWPDDLSAALSTRLLELAARGPEALRAFADVSEELAARIAAQAPFALSFEELAGKVQTRAYSLARVRRALLHILLGLTEDDMQRPVQALKILGIRRTSPLPGLLKKTAALPLVAKTADAPEALVKEYAAARALYVQTAFFACGTRLKDEYRRSPVIF